jgi:ABC-type transport system involved in multi-copper enzyme maturation permease subunit
VKLFAVLKDSFREAIDFKVFYVMIAMSCGLILFVAGISFVPDKPDEMMKFLSLSLNGDLFEAIQGKKPRVPDNRTIAAYEVKNVEPVDTETPTPGSTFRITLRMQVVSADEKAKIENAPEATLKFIEDRFAAGDDLRVYNVSDVKMVKPPEEAGAANALYFEFTASPTPMARRIWPHKLRFFTAKIPLLDDHGIPLGFAVWFIEDLMVTGWGAGVAILVSIIVTSMFIPNMIQKGTVEMLLVKPMPRPLLLTYKYLGGLIFMFLNTALVVLGIWTVMGLRSGIWATGFLITVFVMTFSFAILYSVSTLFGVLSRSAIVSILVTCITWAGLFGVGKWYVFVEERRVQDVAMKMNRDDPIESQWYYQVPSVLHWVLPRYKDLDALTTSFLIKDLVTANQLDESKRPATNINWTQSVLVNVAFIGLMLGLACWRFSTRDY